MMVNCPFHMDSVPSMKIYGNFAWCFVCHMQIPTSELNLPENQRHQTKHEPTNIAERVKYIKSLPKEKIRGLELHTDLEGFYILWPKENYYKKRLYNGKSRYIGPAGVRAPLLIMPEFTNHLVVVEGELNALSLYDSDIGDYTVCSPGSAGEFMRHMATYKSYKRVTLILDNDAAGLLHGLQTKEVLLKAGIWASIVLMKKDFNQILQDDGEEAVRQKLQEAIK
jgi:Toprim domain